LGTVTGSTTAPATRIGIIAHLQEAGIGGIVGRGVAMVVRKRGPRRAAIGLVGLATLAFAGGPAGAVVGGTEAAPEGAVMVLSSKGGVCSAVVVAPDAVLTAGHCAAAGLEHRVHFRDGAGQPVLVAVTARAVHPGYDAGAIAGRRRSIDLALLRTATPLPARFAPATLSGASPRAGESLTLAGYGADLVVLEPPELREAVLRRLRGAAGLREQP